MMFQSSMTGTWQAYLVLHFEAYGQGAYRLADWYLQEAARFWLLENRKP